MYAILIPVFNCNVVSLVNSLHKQAIDLDRDFEIICMDDCSKLYKEENSAISTLQFCSYVELSENIGRAAIRNRLAELAKYQYLIFMDSDAAVYSDQYLANYLNKISPYRVICGGYHYPEYDLDYEYSLRHKYGRLREVCDADKRQLKPYNQFSTFNFLVPKEILLKIKFDETIRSYGHEDTLFGFQLKKLNIEILHINNELLHLNMTSNADFLKQVRDSIENLIKIKSKTDHKELNEFIRILKIQKKLSPLSILMKRVYPIFGDSLEKIILKSGSSIYWLDLYKLIYLFHIEAKVIIDDQLPQYKSFRG